MATHDPAFDLPGDLDAKAAAQRLKKSERMRDDRLLEPWERYRAMNDLLDSYIDMIEIADRKARFAMIVLGALNALNLVLLTRPQLAGLSANSPALLGAYAVVYIAVSLFLLTRTIGVLRPRAGVFIRGNAGAHPAPRVRFIGDVVRQSDDQYYEGWQRIEVGTLNRELSNHVRNLALINVEKYRALDHVYNGLVVLAVLTALFGAALVALRLYV